MCVNLPDWIVMKSTRISDCKNTSYKTTYSNLFELMIRIIPSNADSYSKPRHFSYVFHDLVKRTTELLIS